MWWQKYATIFNTSAYSINENRHKNTIEDFVWIVIIVMVTQNACVSYIYNSYQILLRNEQLLSFSKQPPTFGFVARSCEGLTIHDRSFSDTSFLWPNAGPDLRSWSISVLVNFCQLSAFNFHWLIEGQGIRKLPQAIGLINALNGKKETMQCITLGNIRPEKDNLSYLCNER